MSYRHPTVRAAGIIALLSSTLAYAEHSKIAPDVKRSGNGMIDVVVQFTTPPTDTTMAGVTAGGGVLKQTFGKPKLRWYAYPRPR